MVDYQAFYQSYIKELKERHEANIHRIRIGIRMNVFLPLVFLFISFVIGGSRFLFLVLWIVSLFGIAGYLIFVEYSDFVLQEKLMELEGKEAGEPEPLIRVEDREAQIESLQGKISGVKKATRTTLRQIAGAKSCIKKSHKQKSHTQKSPTPKSHKQKSHMQKSHTEKPNPEESLSSKESTEIRKELPHA
ncbi:MAG: hypothetical protein HXK81_02235 [Lachnospiraceae bacterium]|nr:hypothetical protein [Lachnospiraceae bacterium]